MKKREEILFSCDLIKKYLAMKGFHPTSIEVDGVQRYDSTNECVILNCHNGITASTVYSIIKKTGDDFPTFQSSIDYIQGGAIISARSAATC